MNRFKTLSTYFIVLMICIICFDAIAFYFFNTRVLRLNSMYGRDYTEIIQGQRGYPRYHFEAHPERGFDIARGVRAIAHKPVEADPYEVWGNQLGCFDNELSSTDRPLVYLAGDSYTWGYAPFEYKFGTLLEEKLGQRVLKCGVTHTGQLHQFSKFKEIYGQLINKPAIVIINYVQNDIENDWAYPHTTVIDGFQVETVKAQVRGKTVLRVVEDLETLPAKFYDHQKQYQENVRNNPLYFFLQKYSASFVIAHKILNKINRLLITQSANPALINFYQIIPAGIVPINSDIARKNRDALLQWHEHAKNNSYTLIVSLVNRGKRNNSKNRFAELKSFLTAKEITYWDPWDSDGFEFLAEHFWVADGHLNIKGNALYADFLHHNIQKLLSE